MPIQTQFLLQTKSLVETINTSTGVDQLLLAGVERVALRADLNTDLLLGGTGCENVAASAANRSLFVVGMDAFSHVVHLFLVSSKGIVSLSNLQSLSYCSILFYRMQVFFY